MAVCLVCSSPGFCLELSCGCAQYCQTCVLDWFREQVRDQNISDELVVLCPTVDARHEIALQEVFEVTKGSEYEAEIEQATLRMTLRGMREMNFCPRDDCDYVGWVDIRGTCSDSVECEKCGEKWKVSDLLPIWAQCLGAIQGIFTEEDDSLSILWKILWAKACPGCNVYIEKNGGCPNMICYRCNLHFCWVCMKPNRIHDNDVCARYSLIWVTIYVIFVVFLTLKLSHILEMTELLMLHLGLGVCAVVLTVAGGVTVAYSIYHQYDRNLGARSAIFGVCVTLNVWLAFSSTMGRVMCGYEVALLIAGMHCGLCLSFKKYI